MSDQKCLGSNAYWWTRLKKPDTLRPYLRIAEGLKIPMPLIVRDDYEYDPNSKHTPRVMCHADMQHVAWYPYLKQTMYFPHTPLVEISRPHVPLFFRPWNSACNITRARDIIAEHLARNELSLQSYVKDCDLLEESKYESKSDVYSWNDWDNINMDTLSWKENYVADAMQHTWWKDSNKRTAWHSKTVAAMRARSTTELKEQEAQREQEIIVARLKSVTLETPNEQIKEMVNHLQRDPLKTCTALAASRYNAGVYGCDNDASYKSGNKTRRYAFIDDSLLVDNRTSACDRSISGSDDDEPTCYKNEGNDSRHFDCDRDNHTPHSADAEVAQSWTDRLEEMNQENNGLYDHHQSVKTRADRYAAWQKKNTTIDESEGSMM